MERRRFGSTKRDIAVIGQGTWYIENGTAAIAALRRGLDLGMSHIETAEMYGSGADEEGVHPGLRQVARSPKYRPAGLLPFALARPTSAGGHDRGVRGA